MIETHAQSGVISILTKAGTGLQQWFGGALPSYYPGRDQTLQTSMVFFVWQREYKQKRREDQPLCFHDGLLRNG